MKANIKTKEFDAVEAMRIIREKISQEIQGMTFEKEKEFLRKQVEKYNKKAKEQ